MLKKNKSRIIISSIIILLPMIFGLIMWDKLPDTMTTHWGADGNADGFSGKVFAVFGLPAITLILHFVCLLFTLFDKKQKEQNPKALGMIFWILPVVSLFTNGRMFGGNAIPAAMNGKPSSKHGSKAVCVLFVLREPFCKAIMTLGQLILTCFLNGTMKRTPSGHRAMYRKTR